VKFRAHEGELERRQAVLPPLETERELTKLWSPVARHLELEKLLELFYGRFVWFRSTSRKTNEQPTIRHPTQHTSDELQICYSTTRLQHIYTYI
jgi:hypothetical protein